MPGKSGMNRKADVKCHRQKMWQSMRILKRFSIPDILRTVPGATYSNALSFFGRLDQAGFIGKVGNYVSGRAGEYQAYALLKDTGPVMPVLGFATGTNKPPKINSEGEIA